MMELGVQGEVGDSFWRSDIRNEPNIQINLQLVEKKLLKFLGLRKDRSNTYGGRYEGTC
jgi:hypothetical protein